MSVSINTLVCPVPSPSSQSFEAQGPAREVIQQTEMFDRLDMPLLQITGRKGRIRWANQAAQHLLGDDLAGQGLTEVFASKTLALALSAMAQNKTRQDDLIISAKNFPGQEFKVRLVRLEKKTIQGARILVAITDVSEVLKLQSQRADFVANASHELKSPLTALSGFIETLGQDQGALRTFLPLMTKEVTRMRALVHDLLNLARLEIEDEHQPHETLGLDALLEMAAEATAQDFDTRQQTLSLSKTNMQIRGDQSEMSAVFTNLLGNAAKYAPQSSTIRVWAETKLNRILIHFENPGEGIAPEHIPRLTERFYRIDDGRARSDGGTGLGLAIVKHALIRHQGELLIASEKGEGAKFTVSLPHKP